MTRRLAPPTDGCTQGHVPATREADIARELGTAVGTRRVHRHQTLAGFTTFRVGGEADWFIEVHGDTELAAVLAAAARVGLPVTMLGGGSNVLVSDTGVRGLVVRARHGAITRPRAGSVRASAGVTLNGLIRCMVRRGLGGLEAWAGTPGTVGGAVHGNAHFRGRLIGDVVSSVGVLAVDGHAAVAAPWEMGFGYDQSRLQTTGEVVQWAEFTVSEEDPDALRNAAKASLAFRKRTQPLDEPSAGCVFRNPVDARDRLPSGMPCSAGALVEGAGLKGRSHGGARVSNVHGNFLVTGPSASALDVWALIELCRTEVASRYDVTLVPEIIVLGEFD